MRAALATIILAAGCGEQAAVFGPGFDAAASGGGAPTLARPNAGDASTGGVGGTMAASAGSAPDAGGMGGIGGQGGTGVELDSGPPLSCSVAPPGHCAGGSYGWVCWGDGAPNPGCEPAAEQVQQEGAATWCCAEPCAPFPYHDDLCLGLDGPRYFACYQDEAALEGCVFLSSYAVCC